MGEFRGVPRRPRPPFFYEILYFLLKNPWLNNSIYIAGKCPGFPFLNFLDLPLHVIVIIS